MIVMSPVPSAHSQSSGEQLLGTESVTEIEVEIPGGQTTLWTGDSADIAVSVARRTWEVWEVNGVEENRNVQVLKLPATLDAWINEGDGAVTPSNVTTDASGHAVLNFTMGYGAAVVMIQATTADGAQPLATVNFDPADSGETWDQTWTQSWDQTWTQTWDQTWTQTWDQTWDQGSGDLYHDRAEGYLVVSLGISPESSGSPVQVEAFVEYASWEVWADGSGYEEQRDATLSPAYGAEVQWSVDSGGGTLDWVESWTDESGLARGAVTPGYETSTIFVAVSFDGTESATAELSVSPDDGGGEVEEWTYVGAESSYSELVLSVPDGTSELLAGDQRWVTATVYETTWDVYESNWGNWSWENEDTHPAQHAAVNFFVTGGDGSLDGEYAITDASGQASMRFVMGLQASTILVSDGDGGPDWLSASVEMSNDLNQWTSVGGGSSIEVALTVGAGAMPVQPGEQRVLTARVLEWSWTDYENNNGFTYSGDYASSLAAGATVNFNMAEGDGSLSALTATTDANGEAIVTLTMGSEDVRVVVETEDGMGEGGTTTDEVFLPGVGEVFTYSHDEALTRVTLDADGTTTEVAAGEIREVTATVTYESWQVWVGDLGSRDHRNHVSGPAIGAEVELLVESGGGTMAPGKITTDANGQVSKTFTMGAEESRIQASATYSGGYARAVLEMVPTVFTYVGTQERLAVETQADPVSGVIDGWISVECVEIWQDALGNPVERNLSQGAANGAMLMITKLTGDAVIDDPNPSMTSNGGWAGTYYSANLDSTGRADAYFAGGTASFLLYLDATDLGGGGVTEDQIPDQGPDSTTDQGTDQMPDMPPIATLTIQSAQWGGSAGAFFMEMPQVSGGTGTYEFTSSGALPSGVSVASDGTVSGMIDSGTSGTFDFTITVTDGVDTATDNFTITVIDDQGPGPDPGCPGNYVSQSELVSGTVTGGGAVEVEAVPNLTWIYGERSPTSAQFSVSAYTEDLDLDDSETPPDTVYFKLEVYEDGQLLEGAGGTPQSGSPGSPAFFSLTATLPEIAEEDPLPEYHFKILVAWTGGTGCEGNPGPATPNYGAMIEVPLIPVDLEVDSNNDGTIDGADTAVEDVESGGSIDKMGHHLQVNTFDYDADKVPDYIDGITKGGSLLASAGGNSIAGDPQRHFSKLKMTLGLSRSEYEFMFEYSADNPNNMSVSQGGNFGQKEQVGGAVENYNISAPGGSLRIWTKDADTSRKAESITASTAGDFVAANEWIAGDKMPTGDMFLEGVRPSTGWGSDKIKLKARNKTSTGTVIDLDSVSLTVSKSVLRVYVYRPYTYEAAATVKRPQLEIDYSTPRNANTSVFNAMLKPDPVKTNPLQYTREAYNWYGHGFWCASYAGPGDTSIMTANATGPDGAKEYWSGKSSAGDADKRTALKEGKVFWFAEPGVQHSQPATVEPFQAPASPPIRTPHGEDMKIVAWHDFVVPPKLLQKICTYPASHDFSKYGLDIGATEGGCASYLGLTLKDAGMSEHLEWEVRNFLSTTYGVSNEFPVVPIPWLDWMGAWSIAAVIELARDNFAAATGTDTWGGNTPAWQLNFYDPGLLAKWMDELRRTNKRTSTIYKTMPTAP